MVYGESAATMSNVEGRLLYALGNGDGTLGSQQYFSGFYMAQDAKMNDPLIVQFKINQGCGGDDFGHRSNAVLHDFNGDGLTDIMAASNKYSSSSITRAKDGVSLPLTIFYNDGTEKSFSFSNANSENVKEKDGTVIEYRNMMISYEDIDGDNIKDLISSVGEYGGLKIWKNSGSNSQPVFEKPFDVNTTGLDISTSNGWYMGTVDLDGDGDRDITMCGFGTPLYWIENLSGGTDLETLSFQKTGMNVIITKSDNFISVSLGRERMLTQISLVDIMGRSLYEVQKTDNVFEIPHNLASGQYWLRISNKDFTTTKKVVLLD